MKRREFFISPLAFGSGLAAASTTARPRLFCDSTRIRDLQLRLRSDSAASEPWNRFIQHADQLVDTGLVTQSAAEQGSGDDANFGRPSQQIVDMAFTLGLAYQVSKRQQYADKLREALLHYTGYSAWHGPGFPKRVPPWHSELNTARFCVGVGAGFDALYNFLSGPDRQTIANALIRMGIIATFEDWLTPGTRIHTLDSMGHNWWAVCVSSVGVAALALVGEDQRAQGWLDRVNEAITAWFAFKGNVLQNKSLNFDSGGAFYESVNYANYALSEYLRFRLAYSNVFPHQEQPDYPPLRQSCEYFFQTFYPSATASLCTNFGDSSIHLEVPSTVRLLIETGYSHPAAGWYLSKARSVSQHPQALDLLMRQPVPAPEPPKMPHSVLYSDIGWAILRDSWEDDSTLLAVKSGFTWNHAHADAGSFLLFHAGVPLFIDSGTCGYSRPEYSRYYVQSPAHNVILFNGDGEPADDHLRGVKFPGRLHKLVDRLGVKYLFADATGPVAGYCSRNYRHWLWIDGVILLFDDLLTHQAMTFDWLLHYQGTARQEGSKLQFINGPARADLQFVYPEVLDTREERGLAEHQPDRTIPYFAFRTRRPARVQKFIAAITPYPRAADATALPQIEPLAGTDALGIRVTHAKTVTDVYLNLQADGRRMHLNSNNTIAGWETDAYLLAWTRPLDRAADTSAINRFLVACGSYLRRENRVYLNSQSKVFAVWAP